MDFITASKASPAGYPILAESEDILFCDYHTHSTYSDGRTGLEQMVEAAIARGMKRLGLSNHSFTAFDTGYCMSESQYPLYQAGMLHLKEKYKDQIALFCGIEQDYDSELKTEGFDYVIGSCHYLFKGDKWYPTDYDGEKLLRCADDFFGGDIYALCEAYYEKMGNMYEKTRCDIVGHFDVITKQNKDGCIFDEHHPRYIAAWQKAVDKLIAAGVIIEVNAAGRKYGKGGPYPSPEIVSYIMARGGRMLVDSDSHDPSWIGRGFETIARKM